MGMGLETFFLSTMSRGPTSLPADILGSVGGPRNFSKIADAVAVEGSTFPPLKLFSASRKSDLSLKSSWKTARLGSHKAGGDGWSFSCEEEIWDSGERLLKVEARTRREVERRGMT